MIFFNRHYSHFLSLQEEDFVEEEVEVVEAAVVVDAEEEGNVCY